MSGDLEQCLDDDETLHMAKHHLAKLAKSSVADDHSSATDTYT